MRARPCSSWVSSRVADFSAATRSRSASARAVGAGVRFVGPLRGGGQLRLQARLRGMAGVQLDAGDGELAVQFAGAGGAVGQPGFHLPDRLLGGAAIAVGAGGHLVGPTGLGVQLIAGGRQLAGQLVHASL